MLLQYYRIYESNPVELYIAAFENSTYFETLLNLLENIVSQERNLKKPA